MRGSYVLHRPPSPRKGGMPLSTLMPAPVKAVRYFAERMSAAAARMRDGRGAQRSIPRRRAAAACQRPISGGAAAIPGKVRITAIRPGQ
jgi:hypothetical protein